MALVWGLMNEVHSEWTLGAVANVEQQYDDGTMVAQAIRWRNDLDVPVNTFVTAQDGTQLLAPQTLQPHTSGGPQNIPNPRRWHAYGDDQPNVNLAPWSTPTAP